MIHGGLNAAVLRASLAQNITAETAVLLDRYHQVRVGDDGKGFGKLEASVSRFVASGGGQADFSDVFFAFE